MHLNHYLKYIAKIILQSIDQKKIGDKITICITSIVVHHNI